MNPKEQLANMAPLPEEPSFEKPEATRKTIEQLLKENGIDTGIDIALYLGKHDTPQDAELVKSALAACDIYVPELVTSDSTGYVKALEEVSSGEISAKDFENIYWRYGFDEYTYQKVKLLENSQKAIAHVDISPESELAERISNSYNSYERIEKITDPDVAINALYEETAELVRGQKEREKYMSDKLPEAILEAFKRHPKLKEKEKVNILVVLGSNHGTMRTHLQELSPGATSMRIETPTIVRSFHSELHLRIANNIEVNESLKVRVLFEEILYYIEKSRDVIENFPVFSRAAAEHFTDTEIKDLWTNFSKALNEQKKERDFCSRIILNSLEQKGIDPLMEATEYKVLGKLRSKQKGNSIY